MNRNRIGVLVAVLTCTGAVGVNHATAQCQLQKLSIVDGQTSDVFGTTVAIGGTVAYVSRGRYVFHRIGGSWTQIQQLDPTAGSAGAASISGDIVLLGLSIFRRQGNAWFEEAVLTDPEGDLTGGIAALDGDTALVAQPPWVFRFDGSDWQPEQELIQPDPELFDAFGARLALSGDVAVVGAFHRNEAEEQEGAVYVYRHSGGTWTMEQKLIASDAVGLDQLGGSVAVSGNVIVAGATKGLGCAVPEQQELCEPGAAYVFRHDGNAWVEEQKLEPSDGEGNDKFGDAVGISGDTIVVGAPFHTSEPGVITGAAYVYHWDGAVWTERGKLNVSDPENIHAFGDALAVSGNTAIIGDHLNDANEPRSGAAYVFAIGGDCDANGQIDACEILADPSLDLNDNLIIDHCNDIPTVSQWGLMLSALLLITAGSVVIHRRRIRIA